MAGDIWVWIRVPLNAVTRAIGLLKEASMRGHHQARRADDSETDRKLRETADQDDRYAENLKQGLRDDDPPPAGR